MIEREFIREKAKYVKIKEYISNTISKNAGIGKVAIEKTPLGEKIIINAVRPGLIIGRGGKSITSLTTVLKTKFKLENPQIEVKEITTPSIHAAVVAKNIASSLERFGPSRFKATGYRALQNIMNSGALGAEIRIGGRGVPGQKARSWRFYSGYMKKRGEVAFSGVDSAKARADLKSGTVGIQVKIMPPNLALPDRVGFKEIIIEEAKEEVEAPEKEVVKETKEEAKKVRKRKIKVKKAEKKSSRGKKK